MVAKMGIGSAFLLSLLIGMAISEETSMGDSDLDSLVPVTVLITPEEYEACKEYGDCSFTPRSVLLNESEEIAGKLEDKSYFELCRKIHLKMEKLEAEHPEVKQLKLKLIKMFDSFSSEFDFESEKGDRVAIEILDFVKSFIQKLKMELLDKSGKAHKPEPIPVVETTPRQEEIIAKSGPVGIVYGFIKGIPGVDFPNYTEIPETNFTCSDKPVVPGFYADVEAGCQVFHLCHENRTESFLCPTGTIFNQLHLACDYHYSVNCEVSPHYYNYSNRLDLRSPVAIEEIEKHPPKDVVSNDIMMILPVKGKVISELDKSIGTPKTKFPVILEDAEIIAYKIFDGILSLRSKVVSKTSDALHKLPEPHFEVPTISKSFPIKEKLAFKKVTTAAKLGAAAKLASAAAFTSGKAKMASLAALPIVKAKVASV